MKPGEIVTITTTSEAEYSNTYIVGHLIEDLAYLYHPIRPNILIIKSASTLNKTLALKLNPYEKLVNYIDQNKINLSYLDAQDFESVVYYLIINKKLTSRHKAVLSNLCEMLAKIHCNENILSAYKICLENTAILMEDAFNSKFFKSHLSYMKNSNTAISKNQEKCIYRMAGFAIAQIK